MKTSTISSPKFSRKYYNVDATCAGDRSLLWMTCCMAVEVVVGRIFNQVSFCKHMCF